MFICQLPHSEQDKIRKAVTAYLTAIYPGEDVSEMVETAMCERLKNILDTTPEAVAYGLSSERYLIYLQ